MKLFFLILLLPIVTNAQLNYNLDNNLTGSYATSKSGDQTGFVLNGTNNISDKNKYFDVNPYYSLRYSGTNKIDNELLSREDIGFFDNTVSAFVVHQYNMSFIRGITSDNWFGVGVGKKIYETNHFDLSLSYCFENEYRKYDNLPMETIYRNSFRIKTKFIYKDIQLHLEYYIQPNINNENDINIFGTASLNFFNSKPVSLLLENVYNFISTDNIRVIQNTTLGIKIKICKKKK